MMFWPNPPSSWQPNPNDYEFFFPQFIVGVATVDCIDEFGAYVFQGFQNCLWPAGNATTLTSACKHQKNEVGDPGTSACSSIGNIR